MNYSLPYNSTRVRLKCTPAIPVLPPASSVRRHEICVATNPTTTDSDSFNYTAQNYLQRQINALNTAAKQIVSEQHIRCGNSNQYIGKKCASNILSTASNLSSRFTVYITILSMVLVCVGAIESESCEPKVLNKTPPDPVSFAIRNTNKVLQKGKSHQQAEGRPYWLRIADFRNFFSYNH